MSIQHPLQNTGGLMSIQESLSATIARVAETLEVEATTVHIRFGFDSDSAGAPYWTVVVRIPGHYRNKPYIEAGGYGDTVETAAENAIADVHSWRKYQATEKEKARTKRASRKAQTGATS